MQVHKLRIEPSFYWQMMKGFKKFEVRRNDRKFQVGDILELYEIAKGSINSTPVDDLTGRYISARVIYILTSDEFDGLKEMYCVLGLDHLYDHDINKPIL